MAIGIAIFSGYNTRAVVAFCRFAEQLGIVFHIIARGASDPIMYTIYRSCVFSVRADSRLDSKEFVKELVRLKIEYRYRELLVLPSTEALNRFMLDNRELLEREGIQIPLVDRDLYKAISDKYSFTSICRDKGLKVPAELNFSLGNLPFVAKPKHYLSLAGEQLKPHVLTTPEDVDEFVLTQNPVDFFFQEYVPGNSYYLLYYVSSDNNHVIFSQENLMQESGGGSIILATTSEVHKEPIAKQYLQLLLNLGFSGLIMIEIKLFNQDYYMIEANPRMWGPLQLTVDLGVPILQRFLVENGIVVRDIPATAAQADTISYYFWSGGIPRNQEGSKSIVFHNYSRDRFLRDFDILVDTEIFNRSDTRELFDKEIPVAIQ